MSKRRPSTPKRSRDVNASTALKHQKPPTSTGILVRAKFKGFYGGQRIRAGGTFTLEKPGDFSAKWMERVSGEAAAKTASAPPATERSAKDADVLG